MLEFHLFYRKCREIHMFTHISNPIRFLPFHPLRFQKGAELWLKYHHVRRQVNEERKLITRRRRKPQNISRGKNKKNNTVYVYTKIYTYLKKKKSEETPARASSINTQKRKSIYKAIGQSSIEGRERSLLLLLLQPRLLADLTDE